jgi:DNA-binding transcriptional ArsR family regulator
LATEAADTQTVLIRVTLGAQALASARFAISPIRTLSHLLFVFHHRPHQLEPALHRRIVAALRDNDLRLVARLLGGNHSGYIPGFLTPPLYSFDADLHSELHYLATIPAERIGSDIRDFLHGAALPHASGSVSRQDVSAILNALMHGETHLAHTLADQLHHLWDTVLASAWPSFHDRMEADIAQRSATIAHDGYITMISQMCPTLAWHEGSLHVARHLIWPTDLRPEQHRYAETIIFAPSGFTPTSMARVDSDNALTVCYPLPRRPTASPAGGLATIIGQTRAQILSALATSRTTQQLAQDLHLTPSTISYHLQLLHRAGLITRTRLSRQVLYQRYPPSPRMDPSPRTVDPSPRTGTGLCGGIV